MKAAREGAPPSDGRDTHAARVTPPGITTINPTESKGQQYYSPSRCPGVFTTSVGRLPNNERDSGGSEPINVATPAAIVDCSRARRSEAVGGVGGRSDDMAMKNEDENEVDGGSEQFMRRPGHTYGRREAEFDENNDDEAEHVDATSTTTPQSTNANKKTNRLLPGSADDRSGECQAVEALPIPC